MKRIMTVDDSATVRKALNMTLTGAGYDVVEASDGEDALKKLMDEPVDLLITDLNMPKLDGISLIRQVRGFPGNRFIPIIMLTTESQPDRKKEGKKAGASGWITKPFKPEQILSPVKVTCPI